MCTCHTYLGFSIFVCPNDGGFIFTKESSSQGFYGQGSFGSLEHSPPRQTWKSSCSQDTLSRAPLHFSCSPGQEPCVISLINEQWGAHKDTVPVETDSPCLPSTIIILEEEEQKDRRTLRAKPGQGVQVPCLPLLHQVWLWTAEESFSEGEGFLLGSEGRQASESKGIKIPQ